MSVFHRIRVQRKRAKVTNNKKVYKCSTLPIIPLAIAKLNPSLLPALKVWVPSKARFMWNRKMANKLARRRLKVAEVAQRIYERRLGSRVPYSYEVQYELVPFGWESEDRGIRARSRALVKKKKKAIANKKLLKIEEVVKEQKTALAKRADETRALYRLPPAQWKKLPWAERKTHRVKRSISLKKIFKAARGKLTEQLLFLKKKKLAPVNRAVTPKTAQLLMDIERYMDSLAEDREEETLRALKRLKGRSSELQRITLILGLKTVPSPGSKKMKKQVYDFIVAAHTPRQPTPVKYPVVGLRQKRQLPAPRSGKTNPPLLLPACGGLKYPPKKANPTAGKSLRIKKKVAKELSHFRIYKPIGQRSDRWKNISK